LQTTLNQDNPDWDIKPPQDAEERGERPALTVLCAPLRPLRFDYLY